MSLYIEVASYFPTLREPWRCSFLSDQVNAIRRNSDYEILVINPESAESYVIHNTRVIGFKQIKAGRWLCPWLIDWYNKRLMWSAIKKSGVKIENVSVIHGHLAPCAPYVLELGKRFKTAKKLLQFHDPDPYGMLLGSGRLAWLKRIVYFCYYRCCSEQMDCLVAISENVAKVAKEAPYQTVFNNYKPMNEAIKFFSRFPFRRPRIKKLYVLHNGVDGEIFKPRSSKTDRPAMEFVIGCTAVYRDWKDQITLLKAIESLKDKIQGLRLKLVGTRHSGSMYGDCKKFIDEKGLPVEFYESIPHEKLQDFYRSLDLFVLPSFFEGFGCVFAEAYACGTPFITCEGQGMDDFIIEDERDIWLCKQQNYEDLAAKILKFYKSKPHQSLSKNVNIDILIKDFLDNIR